MLSLLFAICMIWFVGKFLLLGYEHPWGIIGNYFASVISISR